MYPKEKMEEISTSFCFICLLHLANERGLKLQVDGEAEAEAEDAMDADDEDRKVGNLWDLKVGDSAALYQPTSFANFPPPSRCIEIRTRHPHHSDDPDLFSCDAQT